MSIMPTNGVWDILTNSPFRVLGIWSNGSIKEQTANISRIKAYSKVGKQVSFKADLERFLGPADRSADNFTQAQAKIRLAEDKFTEALFWFINIDNLDSLALNYICKEDAEDADLNKADEIWTKSAKPHAWLNKAVLCLLRNDITGALGWYDYFSRNLPKKSEVFTSALDIKASDFINKDFILTTIFKRLEPYVEESALERICNILEIDTDYFHSKRSQASSQILLEIDELIRNISFDPEAHDDPALYLAEEIKKFQPKANSYLNISGNQISDAQFVKCVKSYVNCAQHYVNYFISISDKITQQQFNILCKSVSALREFAGEDELINHCRKLTNEILSIHTVREIMTSIDNYINTDFFKFSDWPCFIISNYRDEINNLRSNFNYAYSIIAVKMSTAYYSTASAYLIAFIKLFISGKSLNINAIQDVFKGIHRAENQLALIAGDVEDEADKIIKESFSNYKLIMNQAERGLANYKETHSVFGCIRGIIRMFSRSK